ncbi:MAG TPA: translocation/assembly module TamB domain-containing protein [Acetobacteraceae bacterium]|jgi:translocation and assembly module TamB
MRRIAKWLGWTLAIIAGVPIILVLLLLAVANTGPGQRWIAGLVPTLTDHTVAVEGLSGRFPDRLRARQVALTDAKGAYLTVDGVALDWSPMRLLHGVFEASRLDATAAEFRREPLPGKSSGSSELPVKVILHQFQVDRITVDPAVAGQPYVVAAHGSGELDSYTAGSVRLAVQRLNGGGQYNVDATINPTVLRADIKASEPPDGLIGGLTGMPTVGPISIDVALNGPRNAVATRVAVSAGPLRANAAGTLDLEHNAADLTVSANAPAMTPRPDVAWQSVSLNAHVRGPFVKPNATGQVRIASLRAFGAGVTELTANLAGNEGQVHLQASIDGLTLPGQDPTLFASAPVVLDATAQLDAPGRPVTFTLHHPLIDAHGTARTAGPLQANVALTLPRLEPMAKLGGTSLQGQTALNLQVSRHADTTDVALNGTLAVTGGQAQAQALLGDAAHIDLAASVTGHNATLQRLHITGRQVDATAQGGLIDNVANLDWTLRVADLSAVEPTLSGQLQAQGQVSGQEADLTATADVTGEIGTPGVQSGPVSIKLRAEGLPNKPRGSLTAQGALLGAPVNVALDVQQQTGGFQVTIQHADWKSLNGGGELTLPHGAKLPVGQLHLRMTRLADLQPLLGKAINGSVTASVNATDTAARIALTARNATLPGTAGIGTAALNATIENPLGQASVDGTLTLDGIRAGSMAGSARLTARGPTNALALNLTANAPAISGAPARISAAATLNATARTLTVSSLDATWHQQPVRLLAPTRIAFANGLAIEHLRVGLHQAVLAVQGRLSPTLDLTASLRSLPANMATLADPSLHASGTISADAHLSGTPSRPNGTMKLVASGVRVNEGPGAALPAANLLATATLAGTAARVDARLTVGSSRVTVTGTVPLGVSGSVDLRTAGQLDLAVLDPILTAEGRRVRGTLTVDAAIHGTLTAPLVVGTARLTHGAADDFTQGLHISDIAAELRADGERLHLVSFSGRAGPGTLHGSGTIDLRPPMPVDLTFAASNAQPIDSDIVNARLDAQLAVRGDVAGTLAASGTVHVLQANVQVPEKLPSSVVTLQVRYAGQPPPPPAPVQQAAPTNVTLNITVAAPEQVFIRGRGLDVELGGQVRIGGTASAPQPTGGLTLRQGTFSVAGQTLTFASGTINFTGAGIGDPSINLVATTTANNVTATLTISGSAQDPKITLSSTPPLPQDEILATLLFKQSVASLSPFQVAEIGAALASFSGATSGFGDPLANLRKTLGLDRLSVGSTASGSPTLQAGRYIARGVYLGAQQSASGNGTQATVQIDLTKRLKLTTSAGTGSTSATGAAGGSSAASVGLTYQFEY